MNSIDEIFMQRCLDLAQKGLGSVSPNPMVGSVIVHEGKIIGEGYHRKYGEAHAEVNAINSVRDKSLLSKSTIYVSLEPCSHVGKTPACANLIVEKNIPKIVIGTIDPHEKVAGKGIEILKTANREIITGVLENKCIDLNKRFFTCHQKKRPYIILKWAETKDGDIDFVRTPSDKAKAFWITNDECKTLVHKWRTEEDAFLVGTNTVLLDNPQLTSRLWKGKNPTRISIDKNLTLSKDFNIFNKEAETIIFNSHTTLIINNITYLKIDFSKNIIPQILENLYDFNILSLVVEGGTQTLQSFIDLNIWDEARVFVGDHIFEKGVPAPIFEKLEFKTETFGNSILKWFYNKY